MGTPSLHRVIFFTNLCLIKCFYHSIIAVDIADTNNKALRVGGTVLHSDDSQYFLQYHASDFSRLHALYNWVRILLTQLFLAPSLHSHWLRIVVSHFERDIFIPLFWKWDGIVVDRIEQFQLIILKHLYYFLLYNS